MGHGAKLTSAYTSRMFILAAVMYVDDTDLLHWAPSPTTSSGELVQQVQEATNDWGLLGQATGGALKPEKCFLYLLNYSFNGGRAKLNTLKNFPEPEFAVEVKEKGLQPAHITVPQPDGSNAPIPTVDVTESTEMLGIFFAPTGDSTVHIERMCQKGHDWVDRVKARPLQPSDAWLSFMYQVLPGMAWGLVTAVISPRALGDLLHKVFYKALPLLGIRRSIKKEYRMLPEYFQGLGLPDFVVLAFACKVFFLQCHWGFEGATARMVMSTFESFMLEVGLYGNIFSENYNEYGGLATDNTWYKNFWEYSRHLDIEVKFHAQFLLHPAREGDRSLTELFSCAGFVGRDLEALTIFRHFKCVVHLSDILCCDGKTVDPEMLEFTPGKSKYKFPYQKPRREDWELWKLALRHTTSSHYTLTSALGLFLQEPHQLGQWRISSDANQLCRRLLDSDTPRWAIFDRIQDPRYNLRSGARFRWAYSTLFSPPFPNYASVQPLSSNTVALHSLALPPVVQLPAYDFWTVLCNFENHSLWKDFVCDGDGSWITDGLVNGTLVAVHDGSYMKEVNPQACSAAFMIRCSATGLRAKGTVAEWSESADNYRAEILGGIMTQLVLRAASQDPILQYKEVTVDCDNKGVVLHGNSPHRALKEKQAQADVLRVFKRTINEQHFEVKMEWVPSHQDDKISWGQCTLKEKINIKVDKLAKAALIAAIAENEYVDSGFPGEHITISTDGRKVTGSLKKTFERYWGAKQAHVLYHEESILSGYDFNLIWWDGVGAVMHRYPKMFRNWVTKQVSGSGGTNHELSKMDVTDTVIDECPNCQYTPETSKHMTRCRHDGRRALFLESASIVLDRLAEAQPEPELIDMLDTYMSAQGNKTLSDCLTSKYSKYALLAEVQDRLGWDNFVEGRISTLWLDTVFPFLKQSSRKSIQQWGKNFIDSLLSLTHKQWIFRNSKVHFKTDGLTATQHDALETRVKELMSTLPSALLSKDRYLLSEDFHQLGEGPAAIRQVWAASMESALGAASNYAAGTLVPGSHPYLQSLLHRPHRFTRQNRRPCIRQMTPAEDTTDQTPQPPPPTDNAFTSSLQRHLQMVCRNRRSAHTKPCGDIRRRRRDTGSCIYKKDWRVK